MIDPFTAFSAAGNALQFAQLSAQVIQKTIEYASSGGSIEHQRLQKLTQQLTVSNAHLHTTLAENAAEARPHGPARALHFANEECLKVCNELLEVLTAMQLNKSQSLWRSVRLALKSIKSKSSIESICFRIDHARNNLVLCLLIYLHSETSSGIERLHMDQQKAIQEAHVSVSNMSTMGMNIAKLNSRLSGLEIEEKKYFDSVNEMQKNAELRKRGDNGQSDRSQQLGDPGPCLQQGTHSGSSHCLAFELSGETPDPKQGDTTPEWLPALGQDGQILADLDENFTQPPPEDDTLVDPNSIAEAEVNHVGTRHDSELRDIAHKLMEVLARFNARFDDSSKEFANLSDSMRREILGRRRILESLSFTKMNDRRNRITRAHGNTFRWILKKNKENENTVWDDFQHWLCGQDHDAIYWIFGKPGCGKSTMIRELDETIASHSAVQDWVGNKDLVKVSCYFWWAGTHDQRSFQGFLQNLLHQLFQQRPDLINTTLPSTWWEEALLPQLRLHYWEEDELKQIIENVLHATKDDSKILLFVDGLDEFDESEDVKVQFLNFLVSVASHSHVKACVASRPWNIFRDRFGACPQLRLEDLTIDDINNFVRETLGEDASFQKMRKRWDRQHQDQGLLDKLSEEIVGKARGVFLWVRLVVRDIQKFIRDGGKPADLFRELKSMPSDLDGYFSRMVETIDPAYRRDAFRILQIALCSMEYALGNRGSACASGSEFLLIHLDHLEDDLDPCFGTKLDSSIFGHYQDQEEVDDLMDSLDRRLTSRCMGLLEIDTPFQWACEAEPHPWTTRIEFLHRTVRDFLLRDPVQALLHENTGAGFDAHLFRCNTLVANVCIPGGIDQTNFRLHSFLCFFHQIQNRAQDDFHTGILYQKMMSLLDEQVHELRPVMASFDRVHELQDFWLFNYICSPEAVQEELESNQNTPGSSDNGLAMRDDTYLDLDDLATKHLLRQAVRPPSFVDALPSMLSNNDSDDEDDARPSKRRRRSSGLSP